MPQSFKFEGTRNSYLLIPNADGINLGTDDYTIEWFQYETDNNPTPRIYEIGYFLMGNVITGASTIANVFVYWTPICTPNFTINLPENGGHRNKWVHFAICRNSGITRVFMDGVMKYSFVDNNNLTSTHNLGIGNESYDQSDDAAFGGYLYGFTWTKGIGYYTTNFPVPTELRPIGPETVLMLNAPNFDGYLGHTVNVNNVYPSDIVPPAFYVPPPPPDYMGRSLYTDNAMVYYKPHSLSAGGIGTVKNSRHKSRKT